VHKADNLPPPCAIVTKSGNLNFLEPSGPVQACNGTALPLPFMVVLKRKISYVLKRYEDSVLRFVSSGFTGWNVTAHNSGEGPIVVPVVDPMRNVS